MKKTITRLGTLLLLLALLCGIFAGCAPATEPSNGSETPAPSSEESTEPVSSNTCSHRKRAVDRHVAEIQNTERRKESQHHYSVD